jgi:hypothetical protein
MEDSDKRLILEFLEEAMSVSGSDSLPAGVERFSTMPVAEGLLIRLGEMPPYVISVGGPVTLVVGKTSEDSPQEVEKPVPEAQPSKKSPKKKPAALAEAPIDADF